MSVARLSDHIVIVCRSICLSSLMTKTSPLLSRKNIPSSNKLISLALKKKSYYRILFQFYSSNLFYFYLTGNNYQLF